MGDPGWLEGTSNTLDWFRANKDILPVLAAVISSLVAVVAVFVGPIVQLIIAHRQFTLTSRQLKLQQKSIALTSAQISANLLGVADQKWIEGFREAVAELDALVNEQGILLKWSARATLRRPKRNGYWNFGTWPMR